MSLSRTHVILCQRRFVPAIMDGTKPHTIRGRRKRAIRAGDHLDLRAWRGLPYRSKQEQLRVVTCTRVAPIAIRTKKKGCHSVHLAGRLLSPGEVAALAQADGFTSVVEFARFFHLTHGPRFTGNLIEWKA